VEPQFKHNKCPRKHVVTCARHNQRYCVGCTPCSQCVVEANRPVKSESGIAHVKKSHEKGATASQKVTQSCTPTKMVPTKMVLVVECLANDDDGEMHRMAVSLAENKAKEGCFVSRIDFAYCLEQGRKNGYGLSGTFDEVYLCGHCRFYEADTQFDAAPQGLIIRPMAKRTLGGYAVTDLAPFMCQCLTQCEASQIVLFACESAVNNASYELTSGAYETTFPLSPSNQDRIKLWIRQGLDGNVSFLQMTSICVLDTLAEWNVPQCSFTLSGMNGVGFISPSDGKIWTFHQQHLPNQPKHDKKDSDSKKNAADAKFEELFVFNKPSGHVISYTMVSKGGKGSKTKK
jgi:hypothetical protein